MKTYKQFIIEAQHIIPTYESWGIISPKHGIVYGDKKINDRFLYKSNSHDSLASTLGLNIGDYAEFYRHSTGLGLRTYGKKSADLAHEYFDKLPHFINGLVYHDHYIENPLTTARNMSSKYTDYVFSKPDSTYSRRYIIKNKLAKLAGKPAEF